MLNIINIILIRLSNLFVMADYNFYISNVLLERVSEGRHYRENYLKKKKKGRNYLNIDIIFPHDGHMLYTSGNQRELVGSGPENPPRDDIS